MTYYYIHDESSCAFPSEDPPAVVMAGDPCVELAFGRDHYLRACEIYGITPEPHPDPCLETRRRIRVAVAAWAYEMHSDPIMSDAEFDALARQVDVDRSTARPDMDRWFVEHFKADTGMWVQQHPEKEGLERIYRMLKADRLPALRPMSRAALLMWICAI